MHTPRNTMIDNARAIGIMLIVVGHSPLAMQNHELFNVIFSFHVPLFFFLSGVVILGAEPIPLTQFIHRKAGALLKPYLSTILFFGAILILAGITSPGRYALAALYATGPSLEKVSGFPLVPLWFLPHLFIATIVCFAILARYSRQRHATAVLSVGCIILILSGSIFLQHNGDLPLSLDLLPLTSGYIIAGALLSLRVKTLTFNPWLFLAALAGFSLLHYQLNETLDLNGRKFGDPAITTIQMILGIYLTLATAHLLASAGGWPARTAAYIGRSTLFILMFHAACMYATKQLIPTNVSLGLITTATVLAGLLGPLLMLKIVQHSRWLQICFLPAPRR